MARQRHQSAPPSRQRRPHLLEGKSVGVVGLGQIGGSITRCLARYRPALALYVTDRDRRVAPRVRRYGRWRTSVAELVEACDIIILATPVAPIISLLPEIAHCLRNRRRRRRLIVMDTGTVKHRIMAAARQQKRWFDFAGMHPLAGTERHGWKASSVRLFAGRRVVVCRSDAPRAARAARAVVRLLGGRALDMDAQEHDQLAAAAIGLPHVLAYVAQNLEQRSRKSNPLRSGSWASLTRVAASDPEMVAGFLEANAEELSRVLKRFGSRLDAVVEALNQREAGAAGMRAILEGRK